MPQPQTFTLAELKQLLDGHNEHLANNYISRNLAVARNVRISLIKDQLIDQPTLMPEMRVLSIKKGWAAPVINMMERRFEAGDLVFLDPEGKVCEGSRIPSIETQMHVKIYQNRPDVYAILHTHPVSSTVFGVLRKPIPVITDEIAQAIGGEISVADYALPGTDLLAENTVKVLGEKNACLLANHGAVCVGKDLNACFKAAIVLETGAEIYQKALAVSGCEPVELKEDDVKAMYDFAQNHYGQRERR